jgi:hypothetical protein
MARVKSDQLYINIEPFVDCSTVPPTPVKFGARLRGDSLMVKRHPEFFVVDGTPDDEIGRLRQQLYEQEHGLPASAA